MNERQTKAGPVSGSRLAALRAALDEGEASGLAEGDSFARVRARLRIGTQHAVDVAR